ncbi:MAG: MoaD/ThiS family protein [Sphingomonadaceae bacterium]
MLRLMFLGRLEDLAGGAEKQVPAAPSIAEVIAALDPDLASALRQDRVRLAINGALVTDRSAHSLHDGDEIAFLPPVSGG